MNKDQSSRILEEYDRKIGLYDSFTLKLQTILYELLEDKDLSVLTVEERTKDKESLKKKLGKKEEYKRLQDITDLSGLRIITYFAEDVDRVAKIIEKEFQIDKKNTKDRRDIQKSDKFGYLSLHYVVSLPKNRLELSENQKFINCKAEIQIRSILQHAWAEIEHDLGYKTELELPQIIRRRFYRVAGLLEVADSEFDSIRNNLEEYKKDISRRIENDSDEVFIDKISLTYFLKENKVAREIRKEISDRTGLKVFEDYSWDISSVINELGFFEIDRITGLEYHLILYREFIIDWAVEWLLEEKELRNKYGYGGAIGLDIPMIFLNYILVAYPQSIQRIMEFVLSYRKTIRDKEKFAKEILNTYNKLSHKYKNNVPSQS